MKPADRGLISRHHGIISTHIGTLKHACYLHHSSLAPPHHVGLKEGGCILMHPLPFHQSSFPPLSTLISTSASVFLKYSNMFSPDHLPMLC